MWILFLTSAWGADVSGYAEMQGRWVSGVEGTPWQATQRFRPSLEAEAASWVRLHVTVEATYWEGRDEALEAYALVEEEVGTVLETSGCPLTEPESGIHDIDEVLGVERLYADFYTSFADIRVGRQALNWGSALGLNPTDLFAEVLVAEPWRERRGVNAIRANFPVGDRHQVVAVVAIDDDFREGRIGLRPTVNFLETDISLVASADTEGEIFTGLDLKGQLGVGWWLEGGVVLEEELEPQVAAGLDYSFALMDGLQLALQYSYDATGVEDPFFYQLSDRGQLLLPLPECDAIEELQALTGDREQRFTIGQHYGMGVGQLSLNESWQVSATVLTNLEDQSTLAIPGLTWSPGDRWTVDGGAQLLLGEGEFSPTDQMTTVSFGEGFSAVDLDLGGLVPEWVAYVYARYAL
jgi:hypothetical protein